MPGNSIIEWINNGIEANYRRVTETSCKNFGSSVESETRRGMCSVDSGVGLFRQCFYRAVHSPVIPTTAFYDLHVNK